MSKKTLCCLFLVLVGLSTVISLIPRPVQAAVGASELRLRRIVFFNRFSQGKNYFQAGQFLESASYFRSLMDQIHELPPFVQTQVRYYYGSSLQELDVRSSASSWLYQVINQPIALNIWSDAIARWVYLQRLEGTLDGIETIWVQASKRIPTAKLLDPVRWEVAQAFHQQGKITKAIAVLEPIQKRSRYYGPARYLTALLLQQTGRTEAALKQFAEIAREKGTLALWNKEELADLSLVARARILFDQAQYSRALAEYRKVSRNFSGFDQVHFEQAWCYASLEQYDSAVRELDSITRKFPSSALSRDAILLAGYFRMQEMKFRLSYATFETAETVYLALAKKIKRYISQFPNDNVLGETVMSPAFNTRGEFPDQVRKWIMDEPVIAQIGGIRDTIIGVERLLNSIRGDIQEVQIITASYGATFENPLTLELKIRDDVARNLAEIQSKILEMMGRQFRNQFRNKEYLVINRAQEVRRVILKAIDNLALPMREEAVRKQQSLAGIADYLRLVRPDGFGLPMDPAVNGVTVEVFGATVIDVFRQTLDERQELAEFLKGSAVDEDQLWAKLLSLVEVERSALFSALKRLGVWDKYRYLVDLDRLYRKSLGLQRLVEDFSRLLMELRTVVLDEVMTATNEQRVVINQLEIENEEYRREVNDAHSRAYSEAIRNVAFKVREVGISGAIGKLDLSWRIHKYETTLHDRLQRVEFQRIKQVKALYRRILAEMDEMGGQQAELPEDVRAQLGSDAESKEVLSLLEEVRKVEALLEAGRAGYSGLSNGSSDLINRPGVLQW